MSETSVAERTKEAKPRLHESAADEPRSSEAMADSVQSRQQAQDSAAQALDQLASVFAAYNDTTGRMLGSYQKLQAEVARLRKQLRQKNEQLERKNRLAALGEMAAGMAHEIRNPLAGIQLYASLLEGDLSEDQAGWKWARKITHGVRTLDAIVNDILSFTQDQVCTKTQVQVAGLLTEVLDYLLPENYRGEIELDTSGVDEDLVAQVDPGMMRRVFSNLVRNAIEAVGGSGRITIEAGSARRSRKYGVRLRFSDSGPGIPAEIRTKIFNPFFTTKDAGTGLGLAIVHRLVDCQGGTITATNDPKGGAVFTILLP